MKKEKKVVYKVTCSFDPTHIFPVKTDVRDRDEKDAGPDTFDAHCPFCGKYVRVSIKEKLVTDLEVLRRAGFEFS